MIRRSHALLVAGLCWSNSAAAHCWQQAAAQHQVDPRLLYSIAQVESSLRADAIHINANGSRDVGLMQINSVHFPALAKRGIDEQRLLADACLSIQVAAGILADLIRRHGYNWMAVGAYNAGSRPDRQAARMRYARKVWQRYAGLAAVPPGADG